jgi:hypothetical protein
MLPVLWDDEEKEEKQAASSRDRVVRYGRFLKGQKEPLQREERDEEWVEGVEGHVEVFDRMDGFQILSMRGPVTFEVYGRESVDIVFPGGSPQMQHSSAAFSAASRDPLGRFGSLKEYLERGYQEEYPCCLCIRLTLRDMRTGDMAVVWEVNKGEGEYCHDQDGDECYSFTAPQQCPNAIGRLVGQNCCYLYMRPVVGQGEAVSMQDMLYRVEPHTRNLPFSFYDDGGLTLEQFRLALRAFMT